MGYFTQQTRLTFSWLGKLLVWCWLVVWDPQIRVSPSSSPFHFRGSNRNPNHRAPNHQLTITWLISHHGNTEIPRCRRRKNNNLARYQSLNTPRDKSAKFAKSFNWKIFLRKLCDPQKFKSWPLAESVGAYYDIYYVYIYIYQTSLQYTCGMVDKSHHPGSQALRPAAWTQRPFEGHLGLPATAWHIQAGLCRIYLHIHKASSYKIDM